MQPDRPAKARFTAKAQNARVWFYFPYGTKKTQGLLIDGAFIRKTWLLQIFLCYERLLVCSLCFAWRWWGSSWQKNIQSWKVLLLLEIDRYSFFEADTNLSAIHGPILITDISKNFKSYFLLHYQKYDVFYALPFFKNLINQDL